MCILKVLRSSRHKAKEITPPIDWRRDRGVDRGSTQQSSSKRQERTIINQTNIGTVLKATLGKLPRHEVEHIWAFLSA